MKMKEWFDKPEKWCQKTYGFDSEGKRVYSENMGISISCCLVGAAIKCYGEIESFPIILKIFNYINEKYHTITTTWNDADDRKFEDIVQLVNDLDI